MSDHHDLCPHDWAVTLSGTREVNCQCVLITRVRERIAQEIEAASEQEACTCHKRYAAIARGEQP